MYYIIYLNGMKCGKCRNTIEKTLNAIDGINHAKADLEKACVRFECNAQPDETVLFTAILATGYEPVRMVKD